MNVYEFMYIFDPNVPDEGVDAEIDDLLADIKDKGGEVISAQRLGKKQLAYTISKCDEGHYFLAYVKIDGKVLDSIKAKYKLDAKIIRYMILNIKEEHMLVPQEEE